MIAEVERDIVARLSMPSPGVEVAPFPDSPDLYRMLHQRGAILVAYRGLEATAPVRLHRIVQTARARWQVVVLARNLRHHDGAYQLLELVRQRLQGWSPQGAGPMWLLSEDYRSYDDGTWQYEAAYACHVVLGDDEAAAHLLEQILSGMNPDSSTTVVHVDQF